MLIMNGSFLGIFLLCENYVWYINIMFITAARDCKYRIGRIDLLFSVISITKSESGTSLRSRDLLIRVPEENVYSTLCHS